MRLPTRPTKEQHAEYTQVPSWGIAVGMGALGLVVTAWGVRRFAHRIPRLANSQPRKSTSLHGQHVTEVLPATIELPGDPQAGRMRRNAAHVGILAVSTDTLRAMPQGTTPALLEVNADKNAARITHLSDGLVAVATRNGETLDDHMGVGIVQGRRTRHIALVGVHMDAILPLGDGGVLVDIVPVGDMATRHPGAPVI